MRILLVSPQPFFRVRGTPINIRNVLKALSDAGHDVDFLCYPFGEDLRLPGLRILRSPGVLGIKDIKVGPSPAKFPLDALMACRSTWLLLCGTYDVVHSVEEAVFFTAPIARLKKIPYIYDMDSFISDQLSYSGFIKWKPLLKGVEWMEKKALNKASCVITVCQALTDSAKRLAPEASVVQIEDAPLEESFFPDTEGAEALREQLGLGDRPCVVYTGNLEAYQGIPLLVEAMAELRKKREDAVLVIVGGEDRHRKILEEQVVALGLKNQIFFTGALPMEKMPACMTLAEVLVSPRVKGENTALKLYGYMQTGKAIVATRLPTHTQILDESTSWLCELDPLSMAQSLFEALTSDSTTRGEKAAALIEEKFGLARFFKQIQEVYDSLSN